MGYIPPVSRLFLPSYVSELKFIQIIILLYKLKNADVLGVIS